MPATTTGAPFALSVPSASTDLADLFGAYLVPNMVTLNAYAAHKSSAQTFSAMQTFSAGVAVTGNSTVAGTLTGLTGVTVASGNLAMTGASPLIDLSGSTGTPSVRVQATNGFTFLNAAGSATLAALTNAGVLTVAAGLTVTTGGASIGGALTGVTTIAASSTITGTVHVATGITGATTQVRYVGGVTGSTAPVTGTFALGDVVVGTGGVVFICTAAGSPGTFTTVGAAGGAASFRGTMLLGGL